MIITESPELKDAIFASILEVIHDEGMVLLLYCTPSGSSFYLSCSDGDSASVKSQAGLLNDSTDITTLLQIRLLVKSAGVHQSTSSEISPQQLKRVLLMWVKAEGDLMQASTVFVASLIKELLKYTASDVLLKYITPSDLPHSDATHMTSLPVSGVEAPLNTEKTLVPKFLRKLLLLFSYTDYFYVHCWLCSLIS